MHQNYNPAEFNLCAKTEFATQNLVFKFVSGSLRDSRSLLHVVLQAVYSSYAESVSDKELKPGDWASTYTATYGLTEFHPHCGLRI